VVERCPSRYIVNVSGFPGTSEVEALLAGFSGGSAPQTGHVFSGTGFAVLGLGSRSWLVSETSPAGAAQVLKIAAEARPVAAVVDQSDAFVCFSISGRASRDLLACGSSVDFRPERFPGSRCAATSLGKVAVLIHALPAVGSFEVYVPRSFAADTHAWLLRVASELEAARISAIDDQHEFGSCRHDAKRRAEG
jgi:sarcosine oxidase subunit gamma